MPHPYENMDLYVDSHTQAAFIANGFSGWDATDHQRLIQKIADQPQAIWLNTEASLSIVETLRSTEPDTKLVTLVSYFIPGRDRLGGHSAGGAADAASYKAWIRRLASAIGSMHCWVILEPDAFATAARSEDPQSEECLALLAFGLSELARCPNSRVYLDVGHPSWLSVQDVVRLLRKMKPPQATGFALNVSNFITTAECIEYGRAIANELGGKHFVIDTSRNGLGPQTDASGSVVWCNPDGRALGEPPRIGSKVAGLDGLLWIKRPGESDGVCNGGPPAGEFWLEYALGLAKRAGW